MCDYLLDEHGQIIVNEWFKFEDREVALGEICNKTGMQFSKVHLESGKSLTSYADFYDTESAECVRLFYKDDFDYFSYDY